MRLKICFSVLITLCAYNTHGITIKETNKISIKEWHCTNICKSCYGEPFFDTINEKCYCSLKKGNSIEDRTCCDAMKMNAKVHDVHLIIKEIPEPSNRVRREERVIEKFTPKTEINQSTTTATETVTDAPELIVAEGNPETTSNVPTTITTVKPIEKENIVASTNTKAKAIANKNLIERKRPPHKIGGIRKSGPRQDKPIDDLVAEAQQKVEEFVVTHRQNPKEAQGKIKDIQGTFNRVSDRLKHNNEPLTIQERINQLEERVASRKTTPSTLIVEPQNLSETNPEENINNAIVGSRHLIHRPRSYSPLRRITHNGENSHLRPRLFHSGNEENTRPKSRLIHVNDKDENTRSRSKLSPRPRLRDRIVGAKNPTETTTQINEENNLGNETIPKNTETIPKNTETIDSIKTDELLANTNVENIETNPINNEI